MFNRLTMPNILSIIVIGKGGFKMERNKMSLEELLSRIEMADPEELESIWEALRCRFQNVFPNSELVILSMPAGQDHQLRQGELLMDFIRKHYLKS